MSATTPTMSIYESTFAPSDRTDAVLLVDGKQLNVNKALLSYHSDYFNVLFNSEFKEKINPKSRSKMSTLKISPQHGK